MPIPDGTKAAQRSFANCRAPENWGLRVNYIYWFGGIYCTMPCEMTQQSYFLAMFGHTFDI